jgi:hypothetical protein
MSNNASSTSIPNSGAAPDAATPGLLHPGLQERDRQMLQEAAHRLLAHGSILRERSAERALYDWCAEHQGWLEDWGGLLGVKVILQREERIIMALPEVAALTRRLRREETLVALALWYDYDIELRENGATEVFFSVRDFNERFQNKFPSLQPISASRLKEVLRTLGRMNLIEMEWADELAESAIRVLPTLRFAIPFPDIEEWVKTRDAFLTEVPAAEASSPEAAGLADPSDPSDPLESPAPETSPA